MPNLDDIRSISASIRRYIASNVLKGDGAPTTIEANVGAVYFDNSTVPPTIWRRKQHGWSKVPKGATE